MSRPNSKEQLLQQIPQEHDALVAYLNQLTPAQMALSNVVGEWAVKDVLAHLTAWEQMVLGWYRAGKRGEQPVTPGSGYNWQQIPALNQHIYEQYRDVPTDEILARFHASYAEMVAEIHMMTNEELFTPKVFAWTKTTTLGSYVVSATCSHYAWAFKEIRRGIKRLVSEDHPQ
jgi:hypothetical protein